MKNICFSDCLKKPKINREWTIQRNWQHLVHKTHDEHKQKQSTTQKKDEHNGPHQKNSFQPRYSQKLAVLTSYAVTNIDKSGKNRLGDRGKNEIYVEEKQSIAIWDMDIL